MPIMILSGIKNHRTVLLVFGLQTVLIKKSVQKSQEAENLGKRCFRKNLMAEVKLSLLEQRAVWISVIWVVAETQKSSIPEVCR